MTYEEIMHELSTKSHQSADTDGIVELALDKEAWGMILKALEKQTKYRWHDLRKDPEDLPEEGETVMACYFYPNRNLMCYEVDYLDYGKWNVAWRYIEPIEEDTE